MSQKVLLQNGRVLTRHRLVQGDLLAEDGIITAIGEKLVVPQGAEVFDASDHLVLPGFIDIHTHGGNGYDMNAVTLEDMEKLCAFYAANGTTSFLATILTDSRQRLLECVTTLAAAKEKVHTGAEILGIHMEGPYLCKEYKGAMPEQLLQTPSLEEFLEYQKAAGGCVRLMTVSPEVEGVPQFITEAVKTGVRISIGHSGADYDTAWDCIHRGAASATHTFNAMKLLHQHFPAISGAVLESDIYAEAICDGRHLHPGTLRILLKAKGLERVIAVTDSISAAGLPDGNYKLGVNDIVVTDGDARLADGSSRAGSTLTTIGGFRNILKFTGRPVEEVCRLTSENPARMLGLEGQKGTLEPGKDADLVVLNADYDLEATFVRGRRVYHK